MSKKPTKLKIAERLVRVLEFFDSHPFPVTNSELAQQLDLPQSSISDLLTVMVDMGLLGRHSNYRYFSPTVRAATLGSGFQPPLIRSGKLASLVYRLRAQTGLGIVVIGMTGPNAQIYQSVTGTPSAVCSERLAGGLQTPLWRSPAGILLLSALGPDSWSKMLHRFCAEATPDEVRLLTGMAERIAAGVRLGYMVGPDGFNAGAELCAVLLPCDPGPPLALSFAYDRILNIDRMHLVDLLRRAMSSCTEADGGGMIALPVARDIYPRDADGHIALEGLDPLPDQETCARRGARACPKRSITLLDNQ